MNKTFPPIRHCFHPKRILSWIVLLRNVPLLGVLAVAILAPNSHICAEILEAQGHMETSSFKRGGDLWNTRTVLFSVRVSTKERLWWIKTTDPIGSEYSNKGAAGTSVGFDGVDQYQYNMFPSNVLDELAKEKEKEKEHKKATGFARLGRITERDYPLAATHFEQAVWYAFTGYDYFTRNPTNRFPGLMPDQSSRLFDLRSTNVLGQVRILLLYPAVYPVLVNKARNEWRELVIPNAQEGLIATEIVADKILQTGNALFPSKFEVNAYALDIRNRNSNNIPTYLSLRNIGVVTNVISINEDDRNMFLPEIDGETMVRDFRYLQRGGQSYMVNSNNWPTRLTATNIVQSLAELHSGVIEQLNMNTLPVSREKRSWFGFLILVNLVGVIAFSWFLIKSTRGTNN